MSSSTGGTTWWRCTRCNQVQGQNAAAPRPPTPAVSPGAQQHKFAMDQQPSYSGTQARNAMPAVGVPKPPPKTTAGFPTPPDGCGVCGSGDVHYVLEQDLGVAIDAADPAMQSAALTRVIRSPFCSLECLAKRLGFSVDAPNGTRTTIVDGHAAQTS